MFNRVAIFHIRFAKVPGHLGWQYEGRRAVGRIRCLVMVLACGCAAGGGAAPKVSVDPSTAGDAGENGATNGDGDGEMAADPTDRPGQPVAAVPDEGPLDRKPWVQPVTAGGHGESEGGYALTLRVAVPQPFGRGVSDSRRLRMGGVNLR